MLYVLCKMIDFGINESKDLFIWPNYMSLRDILNWMLFSIPFKKITYLDFYLGNIWYHLWNCHF